MSRMMLPHGFDFATQNLGEEWKDGNREWKIENGKRRKKDERRLERM